MDRGPRPLVARADRRGRRASTRRKASRPRTRCSSSTRRGTTGKPKGILHTTAGYLLGAALTHAATSSTCKPRPTSTGARPTSAGSPATATSSTARSPTAPRRCMYEGAPDYARARPLLADHREVRRHASSTRRPTAIRAVHEAGATRSRRARPLEPAPARHGRRADQPRGLDVVPRDHRRRHAPRSSTPGGRPRPAPS